MAVALCAAATFAVPALPAHADTTRNRQWHLGFLKVAEAQKYSQGQGITVAVIDTGVDPSHPDLSGNVLPGKDYVPGGSGDGRRDNDGHGTTVAGLIAAHGHGTAVGALGIAPKAKVLPIRVLANHSTNEAGTAPADGINYAIDHGAKVLNISLSLSRSQDIRDAVQRAVAADVVVVAGVGNTDVDTFVPYPGAIESVLTVGAVGPNGNHASISLAGSQIDVAAPGDDMVSTKAGGGYSSTRGTSDSTAIVSGAVALVRAKYPNLSADEVIHRLTATASDKGPPGRDNQYGYGVLNLVAALTADVPPAGQVNTTASATPSNSPSTTAAAAPAPGTNSSSDSSTAVVAIVILVALLAAGVFAWLYARRRRTS